MSKHASEVLAKYREKAAGSVFLDTPVEDMSREDLLGLVGWMSQEVKRQRGENVRTIAMYRAFDEARSQRSTWNVIDSLVSQ